MALEKLHRKLVQKWCRNGADHGSLGLAFGRGEPGERGLWVEVGQAALAMGAGVGVPLGIVTVDGDGDAARGAEFANAFAGGAEQGSALAFRVRTLPAAEQLRQRRGALEAVLLNWWMVDG